MIMTILSEKVMAHSGYFLTLSISVFSADGYHSGYDSAYLDGAGQCTSIDFTILTYRDVYSEHDASPFALTAT